MALNSTELINIENFSSSKFVDLPERMWAHAMVSINESTTMVIGGYIVYYDENWIGKSSRKTFFYNHIADKWTEGPPLKKDRMHHSAILTSAGILVVGGYKTRPPWKEGSVEILRDISLDGQWEIGKYEYSCISFQQ